MNPLQHQIELKGRQIFALMRNETPSVFSRGGLQGRLMDWSMRDEAFKVQMFRFVDVLPSLNTAPEVARHLKEYFREDGMELARPLHLALRASEFVPGLAGMVLRKNITGMAERFIIHRSELMKTLSALRSQKIAFTVDVLGEAVLSESEAGEYAARYAELIDALANEATRWKPVAQIDDGPHGALPRANVSVKISALYSQISPADPEGAIERLEQRLKPLLVRARDRGVFVNFDMESYALKDLTIELFKDLLDDPELRDFPHVGIALQAYLRDCERDVAELIAWARARARRVTIRLIKGAYWDYEQVIARQRGWPVPVFLRKEETDASYERLSECLLENADVVDAAFGTHNVRSIAHAIVHAERLQLPPDAIEIQMLHGMAEPIKLALVKMGHRVREYCPVGELLPGMAYLVRRLLENTSNEGFLRATFNEHVAPEKLLQEPVPGETREEETGTSTGFRNEPQAAFTKEENRRKMCEALVLVRAQFGRTFPLEIGRHRVSDRELIVSRNPAAPAEIVGRLATASCAEADAAVEAARAAFVGWRATPVAERARILETAARLMRERRFELAALEVFEVGKNWIEADGDVVEAIDYCSYYAHEMRRLGGSRTTQHVPGESNIQHYLPRGVAVIIAPWNFPLAILCGMATAALVTGNTIILKPAEPSSVIAARFMEILTGAGIPAGVANFLPGSGKVVGAHLVQHPGVDLIAFTGSKEVGLKIWETAGQTARGQRQLKKVICEMGGKNAIIIDSDADLDEAVAGVIASAFGYAGQKCSACSRVIVLEHNYGRFLQRLIEATRSIAVGPPEQPGHFFGPLVSSEAVDRVRSYFEIGKSEATLAFEGSVPGDGYYFPPTIFTDVPPDSRLAQEEIFGPVLAIIKVGSLDEALEVANGTPFALTGGIYSRSPGNIEKARREFLVGNLCINRPITGAIVERHPFGGSGMSGGGTKAGGPDYLLNFVIPRVVTENLMRRGFAPEQEP